MSVGLRSEIDDAVYDAVRWEVSLSIIKMSWLSSHLALVAAYRLRGWRWLTEDDYFSRKYLEGSTDGT